MRSSDRNLMRKGARQAVGREWIGTLAKMSDVIISVSIGAVCLSAGRRGCNGMRKSRDWAPNFLGVSSCR